MKTLELERLNLVELNSSEILHENGGYWWLVAYGIYLYDNRGKLVEGVKDGVKDFL
jgi:hypothetical protein